MRESLHRLPDEWNYDYDYPAADGVIDRELEEAYDGHLREVVRHSVESGEVSRVGDEIIGEDVVLKPAVTMTEFRRRLDVAVFLANQSVFETAGKVRIRWAA